MNDNPRHDTQPSQATMDDKIEEGFRRGILKTNRENIKRITNRTLDKKGKVVQGEIGKQLLRRKLEKQAYYERNQ